MKKKALVLASVLVVLISVAVFGGGQTQSGAAASAASNEVTFFHWNFNSPGLVYFNDALWVKELEKRTGVKFIIDGPLGTGDYLTAANVALASGDVKDLFLYNWALNYNGGIEGAVSDGLAVNYGNNQEYLAQLPNWMKLVNADPMVKKDLTLSIGGMAQFCTIAENMDVSGYNGIWVREDWLNRLGLRVPTTINELHDVLLAFKQRDANGNGDPNDEIPLSGGSGTLVEIFSAWGLRQNIFYPDPRNPGKLTYWTLYNNSQAFTDCLTTFAQWWKEGLIDTDMFSQTEAQRVTKIVNNQTGVSNANMTMYTTWPSAVEQLAPGTNPRFTALPRLIGPDQKPYLANDSMIRLAQLHDSITINPNSEKAGKMGNILKVLDYMYSPEGTELLNFGVEGVSFTRDAEGNYSWTDTITRDPQLPMMEKVRQYAIPAWGSFPKIATYAAFTMAFRTDPVTMNNHLEYCKGDTGILMPYVTVTSSQADEYNSIMNDINTATNEFFVAVVNGTRPVSDIPAFLNQVKGMGIDRAQAIYQAAYDAYLKK